MTKILNETRQHGGLWSPGTNGNDTFSAAVPSGEGFYSCRLTILSGDQQANAGITTQPSPGQSGNIEIVVNWKCSMLSVIKYQIEAFASLSTPVPAPDAPSVTSQMTGFKPSANGLHFDNNFPSVPDLVFNTPLGDLKIGDAANGLCGGMVFAALDYFNAGLPIPPDSTPPSSGDLFNYIVKRLFSSFDLPAGVLRYIELMNPMFPDGQTQVGKPGTAMIGRAWVMIRQEWPAIKMKLDTGQACPLGLVRVKSSDLGQLGQNHQVLACGYDLKDNYLTLSIYDPNYHNDDSVTLGLNLSDPLHVTPVTYSTGEPLYCFFHTNYAFSMPPGETAIPGRIVLFEGRDFGGKLIDIESANPDLSTIQPGGFNKQVSSFVILGGNWSFYRGPQFTDPFLHGSAPLVLGPGSYPDVQSVGVQDDAITSLKAVSAAPNS